MALARLSSSWALAFLMFSLHSFTTSCRTPEWPAPPSKGHKLSFTSWVPEETHCSATLVFFLFSMSFGTQGWHTLVPSRLHSWRISSLPGLLCPSEWPPKGLWQPAPQIGQNLPSGNPEFWHPCYHKDWELHHLMITVPEMSSNKHITHKTLPVNKKQVKWCTFPSQFPYHLCLEAILHSLQESPSLFLLHCIVFPILPRCLLEVSHKNKC